MSPPRKDDAHTVRGMVSALLFVTPVTRKALPQTNAQSAKSAGLIYVTDHTPGIHRHRRGRGFRYTDQNDRVLTRRADLDRITSLAIPPAWKEVWICPHARGHLQACGRDARGRKQYRY